MKAEPSRRWPTGTRYHRRIRPQHDAVHEEYRILHPVKGERWMESNTSPRAHPDGGIVCTAILHDITERKLIEEKRLELQRQLQIITDNLPGAMCCYRMFRRAAARCCMPARP